MRDVQENVVKVQVLFSLWTPWKHLRECGYLKTWEANLLWDQADSSVSLHELGKKKILALVGIEPGVSRCWLIYPGSPVKGDHDFIYF